MTFSLLSKAALAGLAVLFGVVLGVGIWAALEADDEPTAVTLGVADLTSASDSEATARVEVVRTGDRVWMKFQVRDTDRDQGKIIMGVGNGTVDIAVVGDGDYSIPHDAVVHLEGDPYGEPVDFVQGDVSVLSGTMQPPD